MFPMTVTIHDRAQLSAVLAALNDAPEVSAEVAPRKAKTEKPLPEKAAAPSPIPEKTPTPEPQAEKTEVAPTPAPEAQAADAVTYQQAADAVTKLAKTKGRDIAVGVLKQFGAVKLPDVKPDQYAAVLAACQEAEGV